RLLAWARDPLVGKLPPGWLMPLTPDLIGGPAPKDPLREDKLPLDVRVRLISLMDRWQLCQLSFSTVLPMRPDELAGLLVSDVNFDRGWLEFGARVAQDNVTKGLQAFKLPFPNELRSILRVSIGGRQEGPLLRSRRACDADPGSTVVSLDELKLRFEERVLTAPRGSVQTGHDRKLLFRRLLRELGGVSEDALAREFRTLLTAAGVANGATLYTLRGSVTEAMHAANLPHLEMRYLTGDSTIDILNAYTPLDPIGAMQHYFFSIQ